MSLKIKGFFQFDSFVCGVFGTPFTASSVIFFWAKNSVLFVKFMASNAMRFSSVNSCWSNSTSYIFSVVNNLKMFWVNAFCVSTKMIKLFFRFELAIYEFNEPPMSFNSFPFNPKFSVTPGNASRPFPTTIGEPDHFKKSNKGYCAWEKLAHATRCSLKIARCL